MEKHPRFRPVIWILDEHGASADEKLVMRNKIITACQEHGYTYTQAADWSELDSEVSPDIIFIQDFYVQSTNMNDATKNRLFCSVRYCFANTNMKRSVNFFMLHISLFLFLENESVAREARPHVIHHGHNFSVTGHPIVDALMERTPTETSVWKTQSYSKKKIIWAPHWTINDDGPAFNSATFLQYAEPMCTLAQKYADKLQIAFKPHPTLYRVLCKHPEWGKEKTDAYYAWWEKQPNTQLETGEYKALFQQSDAMIHDSGSFILEYLLMDKPCMYLSRAIEFPNFNEMNKEALKCYHIGKGEKDIETFIQQQILESKDIYLHQRQNFVKEYLLPPNGKSAAENIIDAILEG
ncbi:MAG: CDP-glycerol glycerophosphotransferase family protein [Akkermansia sp.]|nr:CDP-glycerol glycerophosphotransferase family protein [Akkermansia sp.]